MCREGSVKCGGVNRDRRGYDALFSPSPVKKGKSSKRLRFICEIVPACQSGPGAWRADSVAGGEGAEELLSSRQQQRGQGGICSRKDPTMLCSCFCYTTEL